MNPSRLLLGELLVEARIITREQLDLVLELQKIDKRRLGALLVEKGFLSETQLTQILSQQLSVPWVSLHHVDFSRRLLALVPAEIAVKYCLIPIYVRHVRGQGDTLYVAMDDPTNEYAIAKCGELSGLPTRAMIAAPRDIRQAVALYYNIDPGRLAARDQTHASRPENSPDLPAPDAPPVTSAPATVPLGRVVASDGIAESDDEAMSAPVISAEPASERTSRASGLDSTPMIEPDADDEPAAGSAAPHGTLVSSGQVSRDSGSNGTGSPGSAASSSRAPVDHGDANSDHEGVEIEISHATTLDELRSRRRSAAVSSRAPVLSPPGPPGRVMAMTLLDGTQIAVPVRTRREEAQRRTLLDALVHPTAKAATGSPGTETVSASQLLGQNLRSLLDIGGIKPEEEALLAQVTVEQLLLVVVRALINKGLLTERDILDHLDRT